MEEINKAVEGAIETETVKDDKVEGVESSKSTEQEEDASEDTEEEEEEESGVDERTAQALQLLEALEDPKRSLKVIQNLAKQAGLLEAETKAEKKQAVKDIKARIIEKLGESNSFFSTELGEALEEIISEKLSEVDQKIEKIENERQVREFQKDYSRALKNLKITDAEAGSLEKLASKFPWNGNIPLEEYLGGLKELLNNQAAKAKSKSDTVKQQQKNIAGQAKNTGVAANEERIKKGSANITIKEAVEAALRGERLDN